jgi:hypothetical protein
MSMHQLQDLSFTSVTSEHWDSLPDIQTIKRHIALAALTQSELTETALGLYSPPNEIREITLTQAAADQIRVMWHGHRNHGNKAPPTIPLKLFVTGGGQDGNGHTWASIEVHPGISNWEVQD